MQPWSVALPCQLCSIGSWASLRNGCGLQWKLSHSSIHSRSKWSMWCVPMSHSGRWEAVFCSRGFWSLQNLVAISQKYYWPVLISKVSCKENNGKNWLLNPGTSSQSEGYSSKWIIWLVCREPLVLMCTQTSVWNTRMRNCASSFL